MGEERYGAERVDIRDRALDEQGEPHGLVPLACAVHVRKRSGKREWERWGVRDAAGDDSR